MSKYELCVVLNAKIEDEGRAEELERVKELITRFGVGDFGDLKQMVDWCAKTKQRVLQVLHINDTNMTKTWQDSYP